MREIREIARENYQVHPIITVVAHSDQSLIYLYTYKSCGLGLLNPQSTIQSTNPQI